MRRLTAAVSAVQKPCCRNKHIYAFFFPQERYPATHLPTEESSVLSLFSRRHWGSKDPFNLETPLVQTEPPNLPHQTGFHHESPMFYLCIVQLLSPGHPYLTSRCCPQWKRNLKATFVNVHSNWKLLRLKGEELSYGFSPSLQECLSASLLSDFLLPLHSFYLTLSSPSVLQQTLQQFPLFWSW